VTRLAQRLDFVGEVAEFHKARLEKIAAEWRDDPRAVTGLTQGIYALERVLRALNEETDPILLGLEQPPVVAVEQAGLFG